MKYTHRLKTLGLIFLFSVPAITMAQPETLEQKASYALGFDIAESFKLQGIDLDNDNVLLGLKDGLSGNKTAITKAEMAQALNDFKNQLIAKKQKELKAISGKNKELGDAFLAENKTKQGVITLDSGLQYKVINKGDGAAPKATDKVTTHYRGTLIDGTEFDSSYSRNQAATFPVSGVISGWTEALQLMHVGDKWQLFIPSDLAYGERSVGAKIKPNSTLIFEIELIKIN